ncbi:hypothetical protein OG523_00750 [Streptomyces virginiae]|uniref:hypothetical protein n=1 Tax=Streptomyces virginiae TaxID=1961 RepID=UPI002E32D347|nr:hypothetical protein [Streptomyces virginiae]
MSAGGSAISQAPSRSWSRRTRQTAWALRARPRCFQLGRARATCRRSAVVITISPVPRGSVRWVRVSHARVLSTVMSG